ncbi:unnamed protein product [Phytophthora lilii]|uniref:Unnamed protein product n=1 Tax=Phytophthora lilii TaxID=2077276 RepID=A0A9W6XBS0_9STRA|nr:unnamed protein product [Phytophthora lilii]
MLSVPFEPAERVQLIRPDTLEIISVRRQHILNCELNKRNSDPADVFTDPQAGQEPPQAPPPPDLRLKLLTRLPPLVWHLVTPKTKARTIIQRDAEAVRLQNRSLRKRHRETEVDDHSLRLRDDLDIPAFQIGSEAHASSFRPSSMERAVHDVVVHHSLRGKNAQAVLESAQQGSRTKFLATPLIYG